MQKLEMSLYSVLWYVQKISKLKSLKNLKHIYVQDECGYEAPQFQFETYIDLKKIS